MSETSASGASDPALPPSLRFYYIKSASFRVLHIDGAIGGVTPRGLIHCAVYNERPAIPQEQEIPISAEGRLGKPTTTLGKHGVVREVEADLMLDRETAVELREWLDRRIADLDRAQPPKES